MMRARMLFVVSLVAPLASLAADRRAEPDPAVVCLVNGSAELTSASTGDIGELALLDRLSSGDMVRVGASSRVILTFLDGRRFALEADTVAVVTDDRLEVSHGVARPLPPVSTTASLAPVAKSESIGIATAVTRVRNDGSDEALTPSAGDAVDADRATLRFDPRPDAAAYLVKIRDADAALVMLVRTRFTHVAVPTGVLEPASCYDWQVSVELPGRMPQPRAAAFTTLSQEEADLRATVAEAIEGSPAEDLWVFLAEIDRALGLRFEACQDLATARRLAAHNEAIDAALTTLGCRIDGGD